MSIPNWVQFAVLIALLAITAPPLGLYIARVYGETDTAPGDRFFKPVERVLYRLCRVDPAGEQRWTTYAFAVIAFSAVSFLLLYGLLRLQAVLPFNPTDMPAVTDHVAFNAAVKALNKPGGPVKIIRLKDRISKPKDNGWVRHI